MSVVSSSVPKTARYQATLPRGRDQATELSAPRVKHALVAEAREKMTDRGAISALRRYGGDGYVSRLQQCARLAECGGPILQLYSFEGVLSNRISSPLRAVRLKTYTRRYRALQPHAKVDRKRSIL